MLQIRCFTFNAFQENTYILVNGNGQCFIVDPGMYGAKEINQFISYIDTKGLQPVAIINTHAHLDHIFGVQALIDRYHIPFGLHKKEIPVLETASTAARVYGFEMEQTPIPTWYINEGEDLQFGDDTIEVRFTPGHSPGSITFYYQPGNFAIGGDVLFAGSVGRTDLPGGSFPVLYDSIITQLFTLPADTVIYSGHGPSTTIKEEQETNPFLK